VIAKSKDFDHSLVPHIAVDAKSKDFDHSLII